MTQLRKREEVGTSVVVKLRKVVPVLSTAEADKAALMEDLTSMGCIGLAEKPWGFRDERLVRELIVGASNEFEKSLRGAPSLWTEAVWRAVYDFRAQGLVWRTGRMSSW